MRKFFILFIAGVLLFAAGTVFPRLGEANNAPEISVIAPERAVMGGPPLKIVIKIFDPDAKDQVVRFKIIPMQGLKAVQAFKPGNEVSVVFEFSPKLGAPHRFKVFAWDKEGELTREEFTVEVERPRGGSPAAGSGPAGKGGGPSVESLQTFAKPQEGGGGGSGEIETPTAGGGGGGGGGSFREGLSRRLSEMKLPERPPKEPEPIGGGAPPPPPPPVETAGLPPEAAENAPPDVSVQAPGKVVFGQPPQRVVIQALDRNPKDKIVSIQVFPSTGMKVAKAFKAGNPATVEYNYAPPRKISIAFKVIARDSRGAVGEQEFIIEAEGAPPPTTTASAGGGAGAPNNAPSITIQKPDSLKVGGPPATVTITAFDPDKGDAVVQLDVSPVTGLSGGSERRTGNRLIKTFTFKPQRAGSYDYVVFARDKKGELTRESFSIGVGQQANQNPRITIQKPDTFRLGGRAATVTITAYDPDAGDSVSQLVVNPTTGMRGGRPVRSGNRMVQTFTFAPTRPGTYSYDVSARDSRGGSAQEKFSISVEQKPNEAPRIVANDSYDMALNKRLVCVDPRNVNREVQCGGYIRYYGCKPVARTITVPIQVLDDAADTITVQFTCPSGSRGRRVNTRQRGRVHVNAVCEFRNFGSYRSTVVATDNRGGRATHGISFSITEGHYTQAVTQNAPQSCIRNP